MERHLRASELGERGQIREAMTLLQNYIDEGDGAAAFILAIWRFEGRLIRRDIAEARRLLQFSHESGFDEAEEPLMALLATGAGGLPRDWTGALNLLTKRSGRDERSSQQLHLVNRMAIDSNGEPLTTFTPIFISSDPLIVRFDNFLSEEECDELVTVAASALEPSLVVHPRTGELLHDQIRTSSSAAFPLLREGPFLHAINRRIAAASRSRWEQGEPTQILHYAAGQEYKLHSDALPGGNQRIQTFLIYLTENFGGGETYFPHGEHYLRLPKGHAICFSNVLTDMRPAKSAFHAGMPVTHGKKVILSKWIRQQALDLTGPNGKPF